MTGTDPKVTQKLAEDLTAAADAVTEPQTVPVNVYETDQAVVVVAPLPAVTPDDVEIEIRPGRLRIAASLRTAAPKRYLVNEWTYGPYEREVDIPEGFGASAEASLANGQLAVRVLRGEPSGDSLTISPNR